MTATAGSEGLSDIPTTQVVLRNDRALLICDEAGPLIDSVQGALDVIGQAWGHRIDLVVIPVGRLSDDFFILHTGLAGDVLQKFVSYQLPVAIVGSITSWTAASSALTAFVSESNNGRHVWFLDDLDQVDARLG